MTEFSFVGFANYQEMFGDAIFTRALVNTIVLVVVSVPVTWETITEDMVAADGQFTINGINSSTGLMTKCTVYVRSDFESATITSIDPVELETDPGVVPALPRTVRVGFNDGAYDSVNYTVTWPTITPEMLPKPGRYTFEGTVAGTDTRAMLYIRVRGEIDPNEEAADAVEALILAIPDPVTLESGEAIEAARAAYDALNDEAKALVENYIDLLKAEATYAKLVAEKAEQDALEAQAAAEAAAAAALADAKYAAVAAVQAYAAQVREFELDEETDATLQAIVDQALLDIDAAETIEAVEEVMNAALAEMDKLRPTYQFEDVQDDTEYFFQPVYWASSEEKQITNGISETLFGPAQDCTRAQVVTFLWRAAGTPEPAGTKNPFQDVKADQYYYKAVLWAVENGVTAGTSTVKFSPNTSCTRGQIVTFLYRFAEKPAVSETVNPFKDVAAGQYYYEAVLWAVQNGVTAGTSSTKFSPNAVCTRAQVVTFLYRLLAD